MTNTFTAIYQNGYAVFGVGRTLDEAILDANKWLDEPITTDDLCSDNIDGAMIEITITERLAEAIAKRGGDIGIEQISRGLYDLPESD
ncbi:MAG: hypothetical protein IPG25_15265 [Proteobacteria bacterium]|jgi:hypothetical protein|nr:hypothetical protein [Pseudomonadota bacterium]